MQTVLWLILLEAVYKDAGLRLFDAAWVGCKVSQVSTSYVFGKNMSPPDQSLTDHLSWLVSYFLRLHEGDRF